MTSVALELVGLEKSFGSRRALDGLSFAAPRGAITGLIGPNGAGKTTCFSIVSGLLQADAGRVDVLGQGPFDATTRAGRLLALPQDCELPPHTRVDGFLRYLARLQGLSAGEAAREVDRVLDLVALGDRRSSRVRELSHGMRRRVSVAQALLGDPALCLLDEPTSGLDPHLVAEIRDMLRAQRDRRGMSLVVSSHVLPELEAICDHVVFMEAGRAVQTGTLSEVTGRSRLVTIALERPPPIDDLCARLPDLALAYRHELLEVTLPDGASVGETNARVLAVLLELDAGVREVRQGGSLERAYLVSRGATVTSPST